MNRPKAPPPGPVASREARQLAAVILDVLAGSRTPTQAAEALSLSLPRYYQLEARAIGGLIDACEPRPRGRQVEVTAELARANKEVDRLRRELSRTQALVRVTQRTVGVPATAPEKAGSRKRKRKPEEFDLNQLAAAAAGYSGAEIEQVVISALYDAFDAGREITTEDILKNIRSSVPLSRTMSEQIEELREWARTRARNASSEASKEPILAPI